MELALGADPGTVAKMHGYPDYSRGGPGTRVVTELHLVINYMQVPSHLVTGILLITVKSS